MRYFILAGESSGDLYGSMLMQEIQSLDPDASIGFWGGRKMRKYSDKQFNDIGKTSFMGLSEVLMKAFQIVALFRKARKDIIDFQADIVIFIDYPGFNLRMAKWCSMKGFKVAYYISPQIWAWRKYRYKIIKKYVDLFFVILPFEAAMYKKLGVEAHYFGHPLAEIVQTRKFPQQNESIQTIGLLPGSRLQEIERHLPALIAVARRFRDKNFIVSTVDHISRADYQKHIHSTDYNIELEPDIESLAGKVQAAVAGSGTITLQLALFNIPQIVVYKTGQSSYQIAKRLLKVKYISLVNLILDRNAIPELIQDDFNTENLTTAIEAWRDPEYMRNLEKDYRTLSELLGKSDTSRKIALKIYHSAKASEDGGSSSTAP